MLADETPQSCLELGIQAMEKSHFEMVHRAQDIVGFFSFSNVSHVTWNYQIFVFLTIFFKKISIFLQTFSYRLSDSFPLFMYLNDNHQDNTSKENYKP